MLGGWKEKDLTPTRLEGPLGYFRPLSDHHAVQSLPISWPAKDGRVHGACLLPHAWG